MPGRVPGIHAFLLRPQDVDGRDKPGYDELNRKYEEGKGYRPS
jgi:hypothetical protein